MNASSNRIYFNQSSKNTIGIIQPWILTAPEESRMAFLVCYSLLLLLAILGNSCVVLIIWKNRRMRTNINFLIVNMALSDLVGTLVTIPRMISFTIIKSNAWTVPGVFGDILCKLCPFIRDVSISVSIESMVAVAFDRFFAVLYPLRSIPRVMRPKIVLPVVWFVALIPFSLYFATFKIAYSKGIFVCTFIWPSVLDRAGIDHVYFMVTIIVLFFFIPFSIVGVLYSFIVCKMKRRAIPGQHVCEQETRRQQMNTSIIKIALVIVLSFFVCWFPYHTLTFFELFVWGQNTKKSASLFKGILRDILTLISYVSLAINPFICFVFSSNYRNCLKKMFTLSFFFKNRASLKGKAQRTAARQSQEMVVFNNEGFS